VKRPSGRDVAIVSGVCVCVGVDRGGSRLNTCASDNRFDSPVCRLLNANLGALTAITSQLLVMPIGLLAVLEAGSLWVRACVGETIPSGPHRDPLLSTALSRTAAMVVEDLSIERPRWTGGLITSRLEAQFFAGVSFRGHSELPAGVLCVLDHRPRSLSGEQVAMLESLGRRVAAQLRWRDRPLLATARGG
jgi:GAF domain-containing protein